MLEKATSCEREVRGLLIEVVQTGNEGGLCCSFKGLYPRDALREVSFNSGRTCYKCGGKDKTGVQLYDTDRGGRRLKGALQGEAEYRTPPDPRIKRDG